MKMRRFIFIFAALTICFATKAAAQIETQDTTAQVVEVAPPAILEILDQRTASGSPLILQSDGVTQAFKDFLEYKPSEKKIGYRILVYYDNDQKARNESKDVEDQLRSAFPNHRVYRSYASPYFIVYIGNFRTKADAMALYNDILLVYENAKIVKARISWYSFPTN